MQPKFLFILSTLGVQYLYTDILKKLETVYFLTRKTFSWKSVTFAKIRKSCPNRKMGIKHKMLYILPEIECKYSLKHIFQLEMSHFRPFYNKY